MFVEDGNSDDFSCTFLFLEDISLLYQCFWTFVKSSLGYKVREDPFACMLCPVHVMDSLRVNSAATPAHLLVASMAAEHFTHVYFQINSRK